MARLQFNTQSSRRQPIRPAPTKYATSKIRPNIDVSEGIVPATTFAPYRCLPRMFLDTETEDYVVIPVGTIVSALDTHSSIGSYSTVDENASGIVCIDTSGTVGVFDSAIASGIVSVNIDDSYWGYDDNICALLVPANGGETNGSDIPYSSLDYEVSASTGREKGGTLNQHTGQYVTAADVNGTNNTCVLGPNVPIGVARQDIYQDISGANLNYELFGAQWGILCDGYIQVPFCDYGDGLNLATSFADAAVTDSTINTTTDAGYYAVWRRYGFFYFDADGGIVGGLVKSDSFGKFIPQYTTYDGTDNDYVSAQSVGKIIVLDSRYPKSMLEMVDTYPGSQMPGTETGGLPYHLYEFIRLARAGMGQTTTISDIVDAVQKCAYGMARIQLIVA